MRDYLIAFGLIAASILNLRFDLLQKYQRQLTKTPFTQGPAWGFTNRYFASAFGIFFAIFWIVINSKG